MPQWLYRSVVQGIMLEVKFIKNLRDDESKINIKGRSNLVFLGLSRAVDTTLYGSECHYRYIFLYDIIKHFDSFVFLYNT